MIPYSLLDLAPVPEGATIAQALRNSADLARHAEDWGYNRYWLAEHHNMPGIASAATAVVISHIAQHTQTMRVGAGGIMLPNHAPLQVAEAFGTLRELYGDRIDLGVGRAPGTDMPTARALRRNLLPGQANAESFPQDVQELIAYLGDMPDDAPVHAFPGQGTHVPVWMLGSSTYGAELAALLGLPYAFASHFAPAALDQAVRIYRDLFRPSDLLDKPYFMLATNIFAAETAEEALFLRSSMMLTFANLRMGRPGKLPHPVKDVASVIPKQFLPALEAIFDVSATGTPDMVRDQMEALLRRYQPDEVIITGNIHDHAARLRSFEIAAEVMKSL
ncbi:LLM class flavin-dependent oxidoreductase [Celeribacter indicus]|uniref:Luciferase-like monooxygenase n=1 Tax=Celeribacter indicus TaxID=1208324 RepID=A0A0B5DWM5_9RHOB|nr:LLM class flavin-dependent oxidoreductase [Celeribacter indicus]AJE45116.1 luciferase-like protein [Celeribacter indicus]SDX27111.1 luciferase family oxidoreductase, group 1 [Celeribacter indicus]